MARRTLHFVAVLLVISFFSGCSQSLQQEKNPIFTSVKVEERVGQLRSKIESDQNNVDCRIELGKIFLSEGFIDDAIHQFEKVLTIDSEKMQAYLLLSLALQRHPKPNLSRAATLLEKAVQIAPQNAEAYLNLAQVYDKLNLPEKAIGEFITAIELSDDPAILVSSHLGLMAIYKKRGELDKANEQYEAACKIYPGVRDMIMETEISRITPAPRYAGEEFREGDGLHPSWETRVKRARDEISKISGEKND